MRLDPRVVLFTLIMGVGASATMIFLALRMPLEGFLVLLFPSFFLWILIPFLVLYIHRRLSERREEG